MLVYEHENSMMFQLQHDAWITVIKNTSAAEHNLFEVSDCPPSPLCSERQGEMVELGCLNFDRKPTGTYGKTASSAKSWEAQQKSDLSIYLTRYLKMADIQNCHQV